MADLVQGKMMNQLASEISIPLLKKLEEYIIEDRTIYDKRMQKERKKFKHKNKNTTVLYFPPRKSCWGEFRGVERVDRLPKFESSREYTAVLAPGKCISPSRARFSNCSAILSAWDFSCWINRISEFIASNLKEFSNQTL